MRVAKQCSLHEPRVWFADATIYSPKRHGAAALHDLAEEVACKWSRQLRGVRQPHAAFLKNGFMFQCMRESETTLSINRPAS